MLKIDDLHRRKTIIRSQQQVGAHTNYLKDVLEPAIARGNWDELEQMPIGFDDNGNPLGSFKDDSWALTNYFYPNKKIKQKNINFTVDGVVLERNCRNELKCLILKMLWLSPHSYSLSLCIDAVTFLKKFAVKLLGDGVNSFSHLSFELIDEWIARGVDSIDFRRESTYQFLNKLTIEKNGLPFEVNLKGTLKVSDFNLTKKEKKQHLVAPFRIYSAILSQSTDLIKELYAYRDELRELSLQFVKIPELYATYIYKQKKTIYLQSGDPFAEAFKANFYTLESPTQSDVFDLVREYPPRVYYPWVQKFANKFNFRGNELNYAEVRVLLKEYTEHCKYLLYVLSGMRNDELHALYWHGGIESTVIEGQEIYILKTNMSKVTGNTQARQDTFVTTEVGKKAFEVLNEIMTPFRRTHKASEQAFFHSFESLFQPLCKESVAGSLITWLQKAFSTELILDVEDMRCLTISDPKQEHFKLGDTFRITPHVLRRSFAYYLIGYELLSFPQLKQQFSHFSLAMTRHYAKNASKFQKWRKSNKKTIYDEVHDERVFQQAQIYQKIYQQLANNERVAGGKGKAFVRKMLSDDKESLFTDRTTNDMLSLAYWENVIRKKKHHLHVVAPGIICTSTNCSMRTAVSLLDCVDCDNDYIVDAVFAESNRKDAEINMYYDIEHNELTSQSASESYKKIIAAQRIMDDLELEYEPVVFPQEVKNLLIDYVEI
ncbi:site-specific integrase [Vibrio parahaemolyticus]|nr:site-specific integrase [Vibrio parahaemolyticus]EGR0686852.1 site-specific integrase [Vibrio parahaemolyticus]